MKRLVKSISLLLLVLLAISCDQEKVEINPNKAIVGKWELRQQGTSTENLLNVTPRGYTEFLNDSSYRYYEYDTEKYTYGDYTLNDSMLVYYFYAIHANKVDTIPESYYYSFDKEYRTLTLDIDALAILDYFVYKKIK